MDEELEKKRKEVNTHYERIAGLNQKYPVKKLNHPPEVFSFSPIIKNYSPETERKKRHRTQRFIRETSPHDNSDNLRTLITNQKATKEKA